ncbi:MAG: GntR family transcriptional regulator [Ruminococcaceae bacterium]|nr:GntR family transcriptional regulator [Oscillospiraceae bacterium]
MNMGWKFDSALPVSIQIAEKLKREILNGKYPSGSQFPTVRQLAFETSANPNTVQKALLSLETEGLLESHGTVGRFVTSDASVLEAVYNKQCRKFISEVLESAAELGISREKFMEFIKEGNGE